MLSNNGDVTIHAEWSYIPVKDTTTSEITCSLTLPEPLSIPPGRMVRCIFGSTAHVVGPIQAKIILKTKEKKYEIPVTGI